jgi:hypothetical protein
MFAVAVSPFAEIASSLPVTVPAAFGVNLIVSVDVPFAPSVRYGELNESDGLPVNTSVAVSGRPVVFVIVTGVEVVDPTVPLRLSVPLGEIVSDPEPPPVDAEPLSGTTAESPVKGLRSVRDPLDVPETIGAVNVTGIETLPVAGRVMRLKDGALKFAEPVPEIVPVRLI